eukprot:280239-Prymnesium_polylepis.1
MKGLRRKGIPPAVVLVVEAGGASEAIAAYLKTGELPPHLAGPFTECIPEFDFIKQRNEEYNGDVITFFYASDPVSHCSTNFHHA